MADLAKQVDMERLATAIQFGRQAQEFSRRQRRLAVQQSVGNHYSNEGAELTVPVNLVNMYETVVGRSLIAKNPRVMLSSPDPQMRATVAAMEQWVNDEIERMNLAGPLGRAVIDGLYCFGVMKVALADPGDAAVKGWRLRAGQPFADIVDPEDFVADPYARNSGEWSFAGHRYRVPVDVANKIYHRTKANQFEGTPPKDYNAEGDPRISTMMREQGQNAGEYTQMIDLWEIYLPQQRLVVTIPDNDTGGRPDTQKPLAVQKWIGPDRGPYTLLGFKTVANNWMPQGPIQQLMDLHLPLNRAYRKLIRQADRLKSTLPMRAGSEDYNRLVQASDGFGFQCDNPETMKELITGGPVQTLFLFAQHLKQLLDEMGGNLPMLAGLSAQSKTAAQDKMLNENSSRMVMDMQEVAITFVAEVVRRLLWYWWYHPEKVMRSYATAPGVPEVGITRRVFPRGQRTPDRPHRRNGPMPYIRIDPYSVAHSTPQGRLQFLMSLVQNLTPLMPLFQQQGVQMDVSAFLKMVAKYGDEPDVTELFKISEPPAPPEAGGGGGGGGGGGDVRTLPSQTSREYVRRSQGDQSGQQRKADIMAQLMTGGNQNGEQQ